MTEVAGQHLESGTLVSRYKVVEVLGAGGFGVTYKAFDTRLHCEVAVKEYLPAEFSVRAEKTTVMPRSQDTAGFYKEGLVRFLDEARVLAKFKNRHIVRVSDYMEVNGTAYLVMDYEEGQSLQDLIRQHGGVLAETEIKRIFIPILDGLKAVHEAGLLHRDVKPDNIYLRRDGPPVLLDFGAARQYTANQTRGVTAIVTPGYAPFEQYHPKGKLGAWTDLYAIGASMYHCIVGKTPVDALSRQAEAGVDPLPFAIDVAGEGFSGGLLRTVDWMLRQPIHERPQSVDEVLPCIHGRAEPPVAPHLQAHTAIATEFVPAPDATPVEERSRRPETAPSEPAGGVATELHPAHQGAGKGKVETASGGRRGVGLIAGVAAAVVVAAGIGWWYVQDRNEQQLAVLQQDAIKQKQLSNVREQLSNAERALAAGRYTAPENDNALAHLRLALQLDPASEEARQRLDELFQALLSRSETSSAIADFAGARIYLDSASEIYPGSSDVESARTAIDNLEAARLAQFEAEQVTAEQTAKVAAASAARKELEEAEAIRLAQTEAEREAKVTTEAQAAEEAARKAVEEAEAVRLAQVEAEREAKVTAEAQAAEEAARKSAEEAEAARLAQTEAEREAKEVAKAQAAEEAARKAVEEAEAIRLAQAEAAKKEAVSVTPANIDTGATEETGGWEPTNTIAAVSDQGAADAASLQQGGDAGKKSDTVTANVDEFLSALTRAPGQAGAAAGNSASAAQPSNTRAGPSADLDDMLQRAESYFSASLLISPAGRNAQATYQEVLSLDADNEVALAGLDRIGSVYGKAASAMREAGRLEISRQITERGLAAVPSHPDLLQLRSQLASQ